VHLSTSDPTTIISIPKLRGALNGRVIAPGDPDYDQARTVFVGGIDRHPVVTSRPPTPATSPASSRCPARPGWSSPCAAAATAAPSTVPGGAGRHCGVGQHRAGRVADRGGVGVDPDDELDLAF
jgi:hypothetical protein